MTAFLGERVMEWSDRIVIDDPLASAPDINELHGEVRYVAWLKEREAQRQKAVDFFCGILRAKEIAAANMLNASFGAFYV